MTASRATLRLLEVAGQLDSTADPVVRADLATSAADCRIAINCCRGIPLGDIDPASGLALARVPKYPRHS